MAQSSHTGESHPYVPTEPCMNLCHHTACPAFLRELFLLSHECNVENPLKQTTRAKRRGVSGFQLQNSEFCFKEQSKEALTYACQKHLKYSNGSRHLKHL